MKGARMASGGKALSPAAAGALGSVGAVTLAAVLVLSGLMACVLPSSTWLLSSAVSDDATSPYERAELTEAALAARDYTMGSHDREALDEALDRLKENLAETASSRGLSGSEAPSPHGLPSTSAFTFGEEATLTEDAISHLDDVWNVLQPVYAVYLTAVALTAACTVLLVRGMRAEGSKANAARGALRAMLATPAVLVLAAFALFAGWAALDFDGMFSAFHSLFFAAGTWTFSYESLLICMYPIAFWTGMATIWLLTTVAACAGCLAIARKLSPAR